MCIVTPRMYLSIFVSPTLAIFRLCDMIFPSVVGFCLLFCILFMSCISYRVIMCISFAYVFVSCIRAFSPLSVSQSDTHTCTSAPPLVSFSCAGVERSRNGPSLAKWPWYSTGRPPVNFRVIWSSFDTPTVNRTPAEASFKLQPNTPSKQPNNPSKSLSCSPSSDHDRVGKNRTSFGAS